MYGPAYFVKRMYNKIPQLRRFYYHLHEIVDRSIYRIMKRLKESPLYQNTYVIFTSDHGDLLGTHGGLQQKWFQAYEEAIRVPLIISHPSLIPSLKKTLDIDKSLEIEEIESVIASHVDILPTILSLAKIKPVYKHTPPVGKDLSGYLRYKNNPPQGSLSSVSSLSDSLQSVSPLSSVSPITVSPLSSASPIAVSSIYFATDDHVLDGDTQISAVAHVLPTISRILLDVEFDSPQGSADSVEACITFLKYELSIGAPGVDPLIPLPDMFYNTCSSPSSHSPPVTVAHSAAATTVSPINQLNVNLKNEYINKPVQSLIRRGSITRRNSKRSQSLEPPKYIKNRKNSEMVNRIEWTKITIKSTYPYNDVNENVNKNIENVNENINIIHLNCSFFDYYRKYLFSFIFLIIKFFLQIFYLFYALYKIPDLRCILLQSPPAIPTIFLCYFFSKIKKCYFIIDIHNYGYTLFNINYLKKIIKFFECISIHICDNYICVSKLFENDLKYIYNKKPILLYDKPYKYYKILSNFEKHILFYKLFSNLSPDTFDLTKTSIIFPVSKFINSTNDNIIEDTLFTVMKTNDREPMKYEIEYKNVGLIVTATSWTEDEDIKMLLDSLKIYENKYNEQNEQSRGGCSKENLGISVNNHLLPKIIVIITGKGPLKSYFEEKIIKIYKFCINIKDMNSSAVTVLTRFYRYEDYAALLGSATLGISLHYSSSGKDLPMKVVDMLGAGLPVFSFNYPAIYELLKPPRDSKLFENSTSLAQLIISHLAGHPNNKKISKMAAFSKNHPPIRFEEEWENKCKKAFQKWLSVPKIKSKSGEPFQK
eukprot:GHVL01000137.1.p1 GENE.GHVL01000137.1~~GHVL01000137.1.p1  ORF type:complete len:948 (-),score=248.11 GHVL01000137.1:351-2816(-)